MNLWVFVSAKTGMPLGVEKVTFAPTTLPGDGRWVRVIEAEESRSAEKDGPTKMEAEAIEEGIYFAQQADFYRRALQDCWEDMPEGGARERAKAALEVEWPPRSTVLKARPDTYTANQVRLLVDAINEALLFIGDPNRRNNQAAALLVSQQMLNAVEQAQHDRKETP